MALISCPECEGRVSDFADRCPHCGFPIEKYIAERRRIDEVPKDLTVNGTIIDVGEIITAMQTSSTQTIDRLIEEAYVDLCCECDMSAYDIAQFREEILQKFSEIEADLQFKGVFAVTKPKQKERISLKPHCPTCGSTNLTKINAGTRAIDGLFFGKLSVEGIAQFRCNDCEYMW